MNLEIAYFDQVDDDLSLIRFGDFELALHDEEVDYMTEFTEMIKDALEEFEKFEAGGEAVGYSVSYEELTLSVNAVEHPDGEKEYVIYIGLPMATYCWTLDPVHLPPLIEDLEEKIKQLIS